ncbi:MAG: hypothetical protein EU544_04875 [Promethearchaeota archaeon]|nr:MAG: hypothetical protein EU544_04875 [Candidatus Lokiarchaeota archaeon]
MTIHDISPALMQQFSLINIYGKSGTGKTTYALQMLSDILKITPDTQEPLFVWVQAGEPFPKKRLDEMYCTNEKTLSYLKSHTMLYPKFPIDRYEELCERLIFLSQKHTLFTPSAIIIDNISHHLRLEITKYEDISLITALMDDFFDSVIVPLVFYCGRNGISLILIHEVSYNPKKGKTIMFNHNLFSNLKSLNIELKQNRFTDTRTIAFSYQDHRKLFRVRLHSGGISLLS